MRKTRSQLRPGEIVSGPRKKARKGPRSPRFTTHKTRAIWFQVRGAWPLREPPVDALVRERRRVRGALAPAPVAAQWAPIGPSNIGGRMTCVVADPNNPDHIWAGA